MPGASCLPFASDGWLTLTTKLARSAIVLAGLTDTDVPEIVSRNRRGFLSRKSRNWQPRGVAWRRGTPGPCFSAL
jgi:hypothetical protein